MESVEKERKMSELRYALRTRALTANELSKVALYGSSIMREGDSQVAELKFQSLLMIQQMYQIQDAAMGG